MFTFSLFPNSAFWFGFSASELVALCHNFNPVWRGVQPALIFGLPGPSARAVGLAGGHLARAMSAADAGIATVV
jgi:hypothetical protein